MSEPRTMGGIPKPPPGIEQRRALAAPGDGDVPHFWLGGPQDVAALPKPRRVRLRDGSRGEVTHEMRWRLDRVQGTSRRLARKRLYDVFLDPGGWVRAGLRFREVGKTETPNILVSVIPEDGTRCGAGAAGCYSWTGDGPPWAEVGVEYLDRDGPWKLIVGMECAGHPIRMADMYTAEHQPYAGSMGTWESAVPFGFLPSNAEVAAARAWLRGEGPPAVVVHATD